jgi:hypothetical protein
LTVLMRATAKVRKGDAAHREKDDWYATPPAATRALLDVEQFNPTVWEPACGDGAISRILEEAGHTVISTDLVNRGWGRSGRDFLLEFEPSAEDIVTNPPFKLADEFVLHARALGTRKLAMLLRTAYLEGRDRYRRVFSVWPPIRVWQFSGRQTLWRGDDPNAKDRGGAIAFCWMVWERGFAGSPTLGWLP